jgi:AcrR family transcriptional regulator
MVSTTPPRSRRERPSKPALTRDGIIAAAVSVLRAEGLERLTMRRLAAELDTGAASLYVYVSNTAELHAAVLDELLGTVPLTPARAGTWQDSITRLLGAYTGVLIDNASLARSALVMRPSGVHYLAIVERLLSLLRGGGVADDRAAWGIDLLLQYATSIAAEHAPRGGEVDAARDDVALTSALREAQRNPLYPALSAMGDDLLSGPPEARRAWGIAVLLRGIAATPRPDPEPEGTRSEEGVA